MPKDNVLRIEFGVLGGSSISDGSGARIKQELESIAANINANGLKVNINIDDKYFDGQITKIKEKLQNEVANALKSSAGSGSRSTSRAASAPKSGASNANAETQAYRQALKLQSDAYSLQHQRMFERNKDSQRYLILQRQENEALENYGKLVNSTTISEEHKIQLEQRKQLLSTTNINAEAQSIKSLETSYLKLQAKAENLNSSNSNVISKNSEAVLKMNKLMESARGKFKDSSIADASQQVRELKNAYADTERFIVNSGSTIESTWQKLANQFKNKFGSLISGMVIMAGVRALHQVYDNVVKIDTALTKLRIVTRAVNSEVTQFTTDVSKMAKEIGVSLDALIDSTTEFARLGYSIADSSIYAKFATMYSNISGVEINDTTKNLTAIIKTFDIEANQLEGVLDKIIYVANKYAISEGEIGEAMNNASSALAANGNSLEQSIAIVTAANTTLQNISKSSTAVRTIAARISASTAELEELGETDGVLATADLNKEISALTRGEVAITDMNGELRSTYDIIDDLSDCWGGLNSTQRAAIAKLMAGVRQQPAFYSLIDNWNDARKIINDCEEATGTLSSAQEIYINSIGGRLDQLDASWQSFSNTILNSEVIKGLVSLLSGVVTVLDTLISATDGTILIFGVSIVSILLLQAAYKKVQAVITTNIAARLGLNAAELKAQLGTKNMIGLLGQYTKLALKAALTNPFVWATVIVTVVGWVQSLESALGDAMAAVLSIGAAIVSVILAIKGTCPVLLVISAIIMSLVTIVQAVTNAIKRNNEEQNELIKTAKESAKALQDEANKLKEVSDAAGKASKSISELSEEFNELGADASGTDWYDFLKKAGAEIGEFFPNDELSEIESINKLLGTTYTFSELITLDAEKRLELIKKINEASAIQAQNAARETYDKQKNSSSAKAKASGMASINYKDEWGSTDKKTVKDSNKEASSLLSKLSAYSVALKDYDKQLDITISAKTPEQYITELKKGISVYESSYAGQLDKLTGNAVYNYLKNALNDASGAYKDEINAATAYLGTAINSIGLNLKINTEASNLETEYNRVVDEIKAALSSDKTIGDALSNGFISELTIEQYAIDYLAQNYADFYNKVKGNVANTIVSLKSFGDILKETQDSYDLLSDAMNEMDETGILSADTVAKITNEFPELMEYIEETTSGYILMDDALSSYVSTLKESYKTELDAARAHYDELRKAYEDAPTKTEGDYKELQSAKESLQNALDNAKGLLTVIATLERKQLLEDYTKLLNEQSDALESQLDAQKNLIDVRKDLLDTYQEELNYQKELAQKEKTVTDLKTKVAVSKLDTSASGLARTRELESQLANAEEELEEYTLEHAIEDMQAKMDKEYDQYQSLIQAELESIKATISEASGLSSDKIVDAINKAGGTTSAGGTDDGSYGESMSDAEGSLKPEITSPNPTEGGSDTIGGDSIAWKSYKEAASAGYGNIRTATEFARSDDKNKYGSYTKYLEGMYKKYVTNGTGTAVSNIRWDATKDILKNTGVNIGYKTYSLDEYTQMLVSDIDGNTYIPYTAYGNVDRYVKYGEGFGVKDKDGKKEVDFYSMKPIYTLAEVPKYHTGGFVGDVTPLQNNEEFAKLLKGELVTTPAQMSRFMEKTLPAIAVGGGSIEYNAPLVSINCGTVNEETMPELKKVVQEAVDKIKKELDSGMSRTGRNRPINKFSI